ncbi:MAG: hypothetical protein QOH10_1291 [Actinomycetota bacterium]|jgi:hypothetical protein|nr:hypothetical protein [Actinomycetota bacterium]
MVHFSRGGRKDAAGELRARTFGPAVLRVVLTPSLWGTALRQLSATSPRGWWRRAPFAPRPDAAYIRFRIETAYGPDARPGRDDLVAYLRWCKGSAR